MLLFIFLLSVFIFMYVIIIPLFIQRLYYVSNLCKRKFSNLITIFIHWSHFCFLVNVFSTHSYSPRVFKLYLPCLKQIMIFLCQPGHLCLLLCSHIFMFSFISSSFLSFTYIMPLFISLITVSVFIVRFS